MCRELPDANDGRDHVTDLDVFTIANRLLQGNNVGLVLGPERRCERGLADGDFAGDHAPPVGDGVHHCPNSGTLGGTYGEKVPWGWPLPKPDFVGECYLHTGEF